MIYSRRITPGNSQTPGSILALLFGVWLLLFTLPVFSDNTSSDELAVFYPDVPDPYVRVFKDMITGIRQSYPGKVREKMLERGASYTDIESWLEKKQLTRVIALGNHAMNLSLGLPDDYVTVSGAVLSVPVDVDDSVSAVTLAPDPDMMFASLKQLAPGIQTIHVIYEEKLHGRLMRRAMQVASSHDLKIKSYSAGNVSEIANLYREFFETLDSGSDAVWLLQGDPGLRERSVLYQVLKAAWNSKLLVFSSNPSYVSKGVLFALYPDNTRMGNTLAQKLLARTAGEQPAIVHTRDLLVAVNIRTAEHLGLEISRSQRREIDVIFPRQ